VLVIILFIFFFKLYALILIIFFILPCCHCCFPQLCSLSAVFLLYRAKLQMFGGDDIFTVRANTKLKLKV